MDKRRQEGFTRVDLLAMIMTLGILVLTQFPGLANHRQASKAVVCLNNLSQLQKTWQLYADDFNGFFPASSPTTKFPEWSGIRDGNVDPNYTVPTRSPLWSYSSKNIGMWRCPADPARVVSGSQVSVRLRTYSMNIWMRDRSIYSDTSWRTFHRIYDFNNAIPEQILLVIDEHPGSVNDAAFTMDMTGFRDETNKWSMVDFPASNHAGGAGVVFVDGHTELKRWTDNRTKPPFVPGRLTLDILQPGNLDILWIQERSTVKK